VGDRAVSSVKVDLQSNTDLGASEDELVRIKAHGKSVWSEIMIIGMGHTGTVFVWADTWFLAGNFVSRQRI